MTGSAGAAEAARRWGAVWEAALELAGRLRAAPAPRADPAARCARPGADLGPGAHPATGRPATPPLFIVLDRLLAAHRLDGRGVRLRRALRARRPSPAKWLKPLGYLVQAARTARRAAGAAARRGLDAVRRRPSCRTSCWRCGPSPGATAIVADGHASAFRPNWSRVPGAIWAMNRCDVVLAHNDEVPPRRRRARGATGQARRCSRTRPPPLDLAAAAAAADAAAHRARALLVRRRRADPALLAAARLVPEARSSSPAAGARPTRSASCDTPAERDLHRLPAARRVRAAARRGLGGARTDRRRGHPAQRRQRGARRGHARWCCRTPASCARCSARRRCSRRTRPRACRRGCARRWRGGPNSRPQRRAQGTPPDRTGATRPRR